MKAELVRDGFVLCELLSTALHGSFPTERKGDWQDCTVVVDKWVCPRVEGSYEIRVDDQTYIPFVVVASRIGVEGWEVAGRVLY